MSRQSFIASPWLLGLIGVALVAVLVWLAIPPISHSLGPRGKLAVPINNCAQLDLAFRQYFSDQAATSSTNYSLPAVSRLIKEGYFDQSLIDKLAKQRGVYFIYVPTESPSKNVTIQYFGGDGAEYFIFGDESLTNSEK